MLTKDAQDKKRPPMDQITNNWIFHSFGESWGVLALVDLLYCATIFLTGACDRKQHIFGSANN